MIKIIDCGFNEFRKRCRDKKVYCFGAGKQFDRFIRQAEWLTVSGIIDNDENKQNSEKKVGDRSVEIISLSNFIQRNEKNACIVITSMAFCEMIQALDKYDSVLKIECYIYLFLKNYTEQDSARIQFPERQQIPKKIHYCWFGSKTLPKKFERNLDSWKKFCPDYEIIRWDESNTDIESNLYIKQAYERKAWAYVSDVSRLKAVYDHGGIYLDVDVEVIKNLDSLLGWELFCGHEGANFVNFGLGYGAVRGHVIVKELLDIYDRTLYIDKEGTVNGTTCPYYQSHVLKEYGFLLDGNFEQKNGVVIFPKEYFSPLSYYKGLGRVTDQTYSIHWFSASWQTKTDDQKKKKIEENIQDIYKRMAKQRE
ncbi:MAG: hypothetical protein HFI63_11445 [Lachnospiraceae bacterium]|nr:hypothetical protein [Lachnospiraceae bacterium]